MSTLKNGTMEGAGERKRHVSPCLWVQRGADKAEREREIGKREWVGAAEIILASEKDEKR